jgi:cyclopropane fatty-acyl-phospholipid synthase-like methyltransferase
MMENKDSVKFFAHLANNNPDERSVKVTRVSDFTDLDAAFLRQFFTKDSDILDLASGSGLIVNKIYKYAKSITAVELFSEFSKFIVKAENITVINEDIVKFSTARTYDVITMFGISQYFNEKEIVLVYKRYMNNLKKGGRLIVKNQFGVQDDVIISGFSDELKTNYYSEYRHLNKEVGILQSVGFQKIDVIDIYPEECNRWKNTHFHAIVCQR